jgi:hypothetical protein
MKATIHWKPHWSDNALQATVFPIRSITFVFTYVCRHVHVYLHMYVDMYICIYISIHIFGWHLFAQARASATSVGSRPDVMGGASPADGMWVCEVDGWWLMVIVMACEMSVVVLSLNMVCLVLKFLSGQPHVGTLDMNSTWRKTYPSGEKTPACLWQQLFL